MSNGSTRALDLDAIEARAEAATPGPWMIDRGAIHGVVIHPTIVALLPNEGPRTVCFTGQMQPNEEADMAFLRACRADVPALVGEVRRLRAEMEDMRRLAQEDIARRDMIAGIPG